MARLHAVYVVSAIRIVTASAVYDITRTAREVHQEIARLRV